jgi:hypothetical protein
MSSGHGKSFHIEFEKQKDKDTGVIVTRLTDGMGKY